jgi:twinfilin-like protein
MIYFIFHSPDTATVQQRMKHTMAIPGLLVHAEDVGIRIDRKLEIHDPDDLEFEDSKDERVGRFRSVYHCNSHSILTQFPFDVLFDHKVIFASMSP